MRPSLRRPILSTKIDIETLSTESRFTAQRRLTGSSPGSRTISLGKFRTVVVHGAIKVRRNLGMAASRDITTTGLLGISGNSYHQTSPRKGEGVTRWLRQLEMPRGCPTHRFRRSGIRRMRHRRRQSRSRDCERRARLEGFDVIDLDFSGVTQIGQGFADQMFRVWANEHPTSRLVPINANPAITAVIGAVER